MSFDMSENIFTYVLTSGSITIESSFGVRVISIKLLSGTGTFTGSMKMGSLSSAPIPLIANDPVTISVDQANYIDGLIITTTGTLNILARK